MLHYRNYWIYSTGLVIAWAVMLLLAQAICDREGAQPILLVFGLRNRLGLDDDCPLRLSAAKALGSNTIPGVMSSTL